MLLIVYYFAYVHRLKMLSASLQSNPLNTVALMSILRLNSQLIPLHPKVKHWSFMTLPWHAFCRTDDSPLQISKWLEHHVGCNDERLNLLGKSVISGWSRNSKSYLLKLLSWTLVIVRKSFHSNCPILDYVLSAWFTSSRGVHHGCKLY